VIILSLLRSVEGGEYLPAVVYEVMCDHPGNAESSVNVAPVLNTC
jgi:hypothetical protein